mgnify:CR=1 FL=1
MSSVTEQMLIHAQEFNVRLDSTEQLIQEIHKEIMSKLFDLQDRLDMQEFLLRELQARMKDTEA